MKVVVFNLIKVLEKAGLSIHGLISDMGPINQGLWRELGMKRKSQAAGYAPSFETSQFSVNHPLNRKRKLFCIYDSEHLIKNLRNQFLENEFLFNNPKQTSLTSIDCFIKLEESNTIERSTDLSASHVVMAKNFHIMTVSPALS